MENHKYVEKELTAEIRKEIITNTLDSVKGFSYYTAKEILETAVKVLQSRAMIH